MMGRTTLREIRDALTAARRGGGKPTPPTPTAEELEALAQTLKGSAAEMTADPTAKATGEQPVARRA
jgi:hypothetical protein